MSNWNKKVSLELGGSINPSFSRATDDAAKSLGMLGRKEKALKDNKALIGKLQADQAAIAKTNVAYKTQVAELKTLQRAYSAAGGQDDKLSAKISKKQKQVNQTNAKLSEQRKGLQSLGISLKKAGIDTANLTSAEKRLEMQLGKTQKLAKLKDKTFSALGSGVSKLKYAALGAAAAVGAMGTAAFTSVNSFARHGDNVAKTADKLGMSTDALQKLRYAAERTGVSTQTLDMSMQRMSRRIAEAANGTGEAVSALQELGLSAVELNNAKPDKALGLIADRLEKVTNHKDKMRIAMKLFDSEGVALVNTLRGGSKALTQLGDEAVKANYVLDEKSLRGAETNLDAYLNMTTSIKGMWFAIGNELMPKMTEVFEKITNWIATNKGQIGQWVQTFSEVISSLFSGIKSVAQFTESTIGLGNAFKIVGGILVFSFFNKILKLTSLLKGVGLAAKFGGKSLLGMWRAASKVGNASSALDLAGGGKGKLSKVGKLGKLGGIAKTALSVGSKALGAASLILTPKLAGDSTRLDKEYSKPLLNSGDSGIKSFAELKKQMNQEKQERQNNDNRTTNVSITNQVTVQGNGDKLSLMQGIEQATQKALYDFNLGGV